MLLSKGSKITQLVSKLFKHSGPTRVLIPLRSSGRSIAQVTHFLAAGHTALSEYKKPHDQVSSQTLDFFESKKATLILISFSQLILTPTWLKSKTATRLRSLAVTEL